MPDVLVVGSANIDHVVEADAFPAAGETILGSSARIGLGGKGSNQAVAAALAGARVAMIARVGADAEGDRVREGLAARGVDVSGVATVEGAVTGTAWITVAAGDNTIIVVAGANHEWPPSGDPLGGTKAAVVLAQLEVPLDVVVRTATHAGDAMFVLNAAPAAELPDRLLARCDVLVVNEHEQAVVAGLPADTPVARAHAELRRRGARAVVTTLGAAGAVVTDADGVVSELPSVPATVVDTTGAGDAFVGALAARLALGDPLAEAARWGTVAGSLAVRAPGAQESYPDPATLRTTARESGISSG
ncbi:ribokinase [Pseudonocardia acaciae]|uniref:ribokinase n=1 Tax=Pseudonocardia acaciae TaxID=551276 RepID=UPI000688BD2B|nr:ribokinase [Pseudonocardia acaciae]